MSASRWYLEYELADNRRVLLVFAEEDQRDGCHISLDMYRANLGPVDEAVLTRVADKFSGVRTGPDATLRVFGHPLASDARDRL